MHQRLPKGRQPEHSGDRGDFYATDAFTDYAVTFIAQAKKKSRPWFMYLAHSSPHCSGPASTPHPHEASNRSSKKRARVLHGL
jgi:hypothetical protein